MSLAFQTLRGLTLLLYLGTLVVYLAYFFSDSRSHERLTSPLLRATLAMHFLFLVTIGLARGHAPVTTVGEAMTLLVFCITILYFFIELSTREKNLGAFVIALSISFQILSCMFIQESKPVNPLLERGGFAFHAVANILGYSGFFLGFVFSLLYLLLHRQIKRRSTGRLFQRLPSLGILDTMSSHSITLGFVLFTLGIFAGAWWANQVWGVLFKPEPKFVLAIVSWTAYGAWIGLRRLPGWTQKKSAVFSVLAFSLLVAAFLFSSLISPSHSF